MDDHPAPLGARAWLSRLALLFLLVGAADLIGLVPMRAGVGEIAFGASMAGFTISAWRSVSTLQRTARLVLSTVLFALGLLIIVGLAHRSLLTALLVLAFPLLRVPALFRTRHRDSD